MVDQEANRHRAAQYLRMSTEHQKYSTANQAELIAIYAASRDLEIVKTYSDSGRSGLKLGGRAALKQLIEDVQSGEAPFGTILVFDVSRWGRFQDADEGAYYEHICTRAGIAVRYCAEQFENDGKPLSAIVKAIKRAMAGEYSRELSAKVFAGQRRIVKMGYQLGGRAGYGMRRLLVDENGRHKQTLKNGERKSIITDRVLLIPGPAPEVRVVREIFRKFIDEGKLESSIASSLNARGLVSNTGQPWGRANVQAVLLNPKYCGRNVWNRTSFKLKKVLVRNPPESWLSSQSAFAPIISRETFERARRIIQSRAAKPPTNEELLTALRALLKRRGALSERLINEDPNLPQARTVQRRFGGLASLYALLGFSGSTDLTYAHTNRALRAVRSGLMAKATAAIEAAGGSVKHERRPYAFTVNEKFAICFAILKCQHTRNGYPRWRLTLNKTFGAGITLVIRMTEANDRPSHFYLFPPGSLICSRMDLAKENDDWLSAYRIETLEPLYALVRPPRAARRFP